MVTASSRFPIRLRVHGEDFDRVCVRRTGTAVYRGDRTYLRIGADVEEDELLQVEMLRRGFPVPRVVQRGAFDGAPYVIEDSLGPSTLGELFQPSRDAGAPISDDEFTHLTRVIERLARAQAETATPANALTDFAEMIGVQDAAELTGLGDALTDTFASVAERLGVLRQTLLHADLHESNVCVDGVIDLEGSRPGPAGYDVVTAVFVPAMSSPLDGAAASSAGWYSESQVTAYLTVVDTAFAEGGLTPPSRHLDAFLLCRAISLGAHQHPAEHIWRFRRRVLADVLETFTSGGDVRAAVLAGARDG